MFSFNDDLPRWRQMWIITGFSVVLSFIFTGPLYMLVFGWDDHFWGTMVLAIAVPWGVGMPLSWYIVSQRSALIATTRELEKAQEDLQESNKKLTLKANFDAMTGLPNRETFFDKMEKLRAINDQNILLIVDVDHFKKINDSYGHLIGDDALILMAKVLRRILRKNDLVGRIGGEEFGILLPDTTEAEGLIIGEMIRHEIESTPFEPHKGLRHVVTISVGLTCAPPHQDRSKLLSNADTAMFEAKRRGRNQVLAFETGMRSKPRPFYSPEPTVKQMPTLSNIR